MKKKHTDALSFCGNYVRNHAPDYFFCVLLMPAAVREAVFRLLAFHIEMTRAVSLSSSWSVAGPMAGLIRLQWWRDILTGQQDRTHELAPFVLESVREGVLPVERLLPLIEAREAELEEISDWDHWHAIQLDSAGQVQAMLAELVGLREESLWEPIRSLGAACEIVHMARTLPALLRSGRFPLPQFLMDNEAFSRSETGILASEEAIEAVRDILIQKAQACFTVGEKACSLDRKNISALLPVVFAQRDLQRRQQWDHFPKSRGLGDKLAVIKARLTGRIRLVR